MTSMSDAVPMVKLGPDLMVPLDRLPADLRRRWDMAQSKSENGEDVKGILAVLMREIQGVVGIDVLLRSAHKIPQSALNIGMAENDAAIRPLSAEAQALADEAKRKEGIKPSAGKERVRSELP
jgi:hypothetical protein